MNKASRSAGVITLGSLVVGGGFGALIYGVLPGLNGVIFLLIFMATTWLIGRQLGKSLAPVRWLLLALVFFGGMLAVRSSESLTALNTLACILLCLITALRLSGQRLNELTLSGWIKVASLPLQFIRPALRVIAQFSQGIKSPAGDTLIKQLLLGVILALPILVIFGALFASADAVFAGYINDIFNFSLDPDLTAQLILSAGVALGTMGALSYAWISEHLPVAGQKPYRRWLGPVETFVILGSILILFLAFIAIQLAYLFGGLSVIESGTTYAEYARRGFFELLMVAILSLALLWNLKRYSQLAKEAASTLMFKLLVSGMVTAVMVILVSAFRRLWLYEEAFGFSTLRLFSHAFTVYLAIVLGLFILYVWQKSSERQLVGRLVLASFGFLAVMNIANPEALIARLNIDRYQQTGKIDLQYLDSLSADAVPELLELAQEDSPVGSQAAHDLWGRAVNDGLLPYRPDWRSLNLSGYRAESALQQLTNPNEAQ